MESSKTHSLPIAVDVEVVAPDAKAKPIGTLYHSTFTTRTRPAADYMAPGQHSVALPWDELAKALPQGKSKLVARCYYPVGAARQPATSWEPVLVFARPGTTPRFKNIEPRYGDENRLSIELSLAAGESKTVDVAVPYFPLAGQAGRELENLSIDDVLARFREYWTRELNRNAEFIVPERASATVTACVWPTISS